MKTPDAPYCDETTVITATLSDGDEKMLVLGCQLPGDHDGEHSHDITDGRISARVRWSKKGLPPDDTATSTL